MLVEYSSSSSSSAESSDSDKSEPDTCLQLATSGRKRKCTKLGSTAPAKLCKEAGKVVGSDPIREKLPLPPSIRSMFDNRMNDEAHHDDPALHMGRVRSFAHERGSWASLVCIPLMSCQNNLANELANMLIDVLRMDITTFHVVDDLHVSLSKTFIVRHHWIDTLVADLRRNLAHCRPCVLHLSTVEFYCNEEATRTFLGIKTHAAGTILESYVKAIDTSLAEFHLPKYYENPSFHVSLLWSLGDVKSSITANTLSRLQDVVDRFFSENSETSQVIVKEIKVKTGNKIFMLPLGK